MLQRPRWEEVACADSTQILKAVIYAVSVLDGGPGYGNWLLLIMLWIIRTSDGPCSVNQEQTIQVAVSSHSISPLFQNVFFVEQQAFALLFSPGFLLFFIAVWNLYDSQPVTVLLVCPGWPPDVSVCWAHGLLFVWCHVLPCRLSVPSHLVT